MAQESGSEISRRAQGFCTRGIAGQGTTERTTNTGGFLVGYRYNLNTLAAEALSGHHRNTQHYWSQFGARQKASWAALRRRL